MIDSLRKIADCQFKTFLTPQITTSFIFFSDTSRCSSLSFGLAIKRWGTPSLQLSELSSQRSQNAWQSPIFCTSPPAGHYLPVQENFLSFFPSLPVQTEPANYVADKLLSKREPDKCRKYAGCHPVLTPGNSLSFAHMAYAIGLK